MRIARSTTSTVLISVAFLVLVPVVLQYSFSWMGFNPTDDGFTLAYARRILEGQVPHRDFIIIRPFLSPLIHAPFVLLGGDYTFWLSRLFVWVELTCISWIWVSIINRFFSFPFSITTKPIVALLALVASAHTFPIMAWHTIDGLFLWSIGLAVCVWSQKPTIKIVGYGLIAMAYLCKQSFVFIPPLSLVLLQDWRELKYWFAILVPGILYILYLVSAGALSDAILQLTSQTMIVSTGATSYLTSDTLLGILGGCLSARFLFGKTVTPIPTELQKWLGITILVGVPFLLTALGLAEGTSTTRSFGVFGIAVGFVLYSVIRDLEKEKVRLRVALLVLLTAWCASLSIGYNTPALVSGQLLALLIAYGLTVRGINEILLLPSLAIAILVTLYGFGIARTNHIYRDQPASSLIAPLDGVLPGGALIKTNQNTYEYLLDQDQAIKLATRENGSYAIIPSSAALWVQSRQTNPLPIDWTQGTELSRPELTNRVINDLDSARERMTVIVSKVEPASLADGFIPLNDNSDYYAVVRYVRAHFTKVGDTHYFDLYR